MDASEQTQAFADEIDKVCNRFIDEFDLTYAQAVGVLQLKIWAISEEAFRETEEED